MTSNSAPSPFPPPSPQERLLTEAASCVGHMAKEAGTREGKRLMRMSRELRALSRKLASKRREAPR